MSELTIFQFEQKFIRTSIFDDRIVFCLADLLAAIETKTDTNDAKASIDDVFGRGSVINLPLQTIGGVQNSLFVFEFGATFLISRSRTEVGRKLNRWIHMEVLPSIHRTGSYSVDRPKELSRREILQLAIEAEDRALALEAQIEADEPATTLGRAIAKAPNNIRIGDFAKSIGIGQNLFAA